MYDHRRPAKKARKQKRSKALVSSTQVPSGCSTLSAAALYEEAQTALQLRDYDTALQKLQQACATDPRNTEVSEAYGALLAETGQTALALQTLEAAVRAQPDEGHEKYMYLAQLTEGAEAIGHIRRGLDVLKSAILLASDPEERDVLAAQACTAHVTLSELLLNGAAAVADVEAECEAMLRIARSADARNPEPLQALASLRYEQGRPTEALELLHTSMALWFAPRQEEAEEPPCGGGAEAAAEDGDVIMRKPLSREELEATAAASCSTPPGFEFRFECAKLLIELDESTKAAVQVLEDLIHENDEVPAAWHLLALAYYAGGALDECGECLEYGEQLLEKETDSDELVVSSFHDLRAALADARQKAGESASSPAERGSGAVEGGDDAMRE